jgi:hypothetical protein
VPEKLKENFSANLNEQNKKSSMIFTKRENKFSMRVLPLEKGYFPTAD